MLAGLFDFLPFAPNGDSHPMHFESRLWAFTKGLRLRIVCTGIIGLAATTFGVARVEMLAPFRPERFAASV